MPSKIPKSEDPLLVDIAPQAQVELLNTIKMDTRIDYKIQTLEQHNYTVWKQHTLNILEAKELADVVINGPGREPLEPLTAMKCRQAKALLTSALSVSNQMKVINCATAHDIWNRLEAINENKSSFERENLLNRFHSYKIRSASEIPDGIGQLESLASRLTLLGEQITDEAMMSALLRALPSGFQTFLTVWRGTPKSERTINNLITRVMAELESGDMKVEKAMLVKRRNFRGSNRNYQGQKPGYPTHVRNGSVRIGHQASESHGNTQNRNYNSQGPSSSNPFIRNNRNNQFNRVGPVNQHGGKQQPGITCYECGQVGHIKRNCIKNRERHVAMVANTHSCDVNNDVNSVEWLVDSGATIHITKRKDILSDYTELSEPIDIFVGNRSSMQAVGIGKFVTKGITIFNVHYVPEASDNLLSEQCAAVMGNRIISDAKAKIFYNARGQAIARAPLINHSYVLKLPIISNKQAPWRPWEDKPTPQLNAYRAVVLGTWHKRFAHAPRSTIERMAKLDIVNGLSIEGPLDVRCTSCIEGKEKFTSHPSRQTNKVQIAGACLHFDTGEMPEYSIGGAKYFLLCKDEFSGYRTFAPVGHKSDIIDKVKQCISKMEILTGNQVKQIMTDEGTEFVNRELSNYLSMKGIIHNKSVPYTPEQNGYIEQDMDNVSKATRTLLIDSGLPKRYWAEAMNTAIYVLNRTVASGAIATPYELCTGRKPDVTNLRVFGQSAFVMLPKHKRDKLDSRTIKMIFVGYTDRSNTYRFMDEESEQIHVSCNAKFVDDIISIDKSSTLNPDDSIAVSDDVMDTSVEVPGTPEERDTLRGDDISDIDNSFDTANFTVDESQEQEDEPIYENLDSAKIPKHLYIRREAPELMPTRLRETKPVNYGKPSANVATINSNGDPESYLDAMERPDKDKWLEAMEDELKSLVKNNVFEVVSRPANKNIVTNRWVLKIKRKPDGSIDRYRARLVARGFSQIFGVDFNETYAPVVNTSSVRLLFAYAAMQHLEIGQFDVKTAFLYGNLEEEIYLEQPDGFVKDTSKVWRLTKSLYGLKQAPRQWNIEFKNFLKSQNLSVSEVDECIFFRRDPLLIVAIYVDDGIVFARDKSEIKYFLSQLQSKFEIHIEDGSTYLGFQIHRPAKGTIILHQESYVNTIVKTLNMINSNPVESPVVVKKNSDICENDKPLDANVPYRKAVGMLMYAALITRIDIMYAVNRVSRKVANPTEGDWQDVKRILRYLVNKPNLGIQFGGAGNMEPDEMLAYCDADFAGCETTAKSTTGNVILYGNGPVSYRSNRQSLVTLNSTEAELVGLCTTTKDVINLRSLANELGMISDKPTPVLCDNQSTIKISTNIKSLQRTRHLRSQAAFVMEQGEENNIVVEHVPGQDQLADFLTKATAKHQFIKNRSALMVMFIMTMLCLTSVSAFVFERVTPIVWVDTGKYVNYGIKRFDIEIRYVNPCGLLSKIPVTKRFKRHLVTPIEQSSSSNQINYQPPNQQGGQSSVGRAQVSYQQDHGMIDFQDYNRALHEATIHCNQMYAELITVPIKEANLHSTSVRHKRDLVSAFSGLFFSNILVTALDKLWEGHSQKEMEERQKIIATKIDDMMRQMNLTEMIEKATLESLKTTAHLVQQNQNRLSTMVNFFPQLVFTTNYLTSHMLQKSNLFNRLRFGTKLRKLDLSTLFELIFPHIEWLQDLEESSSIIREISNPRPDTLRIEFTARTRDPNCSVYKVNPFRFWANLTGTPTLMNYVGEKYLVYNHTNDCVRAIDEPTQAFVQENCDRSHGRDTRLAQWEELTKITNPYQLKANTTFKDSWPYVYVYCYRLNITINEQTERCPPYVFKLNSTTHWNTTDLNYGPKFQKITIAKEIDEMELTHLVSDVHFMQEEHMVDENHAIDRIFELTKELDTIKKQNIALTFPVEGGEISYAKLMNIMIWIVVMMSVLLIGLLIFKNWNDRHRHRKIARIVTDGIYGDGTYAMVRNTHQKQHATTMNLTVNTNSAVESPKLPPPRQSIMKDK